MNLFKNMLNYNIDIIKNFNVFLVQHQSIAHFEYNKDDDYDKEYHDENDIFLVNVIVHKIWSDIFNNYKSYENDFIDTYKVNSDDLIKDYYEPYFHSKIGYLKKSKWDKYSRFNLE